MEVANTDRKVNAALIGNAGESHAVQVAGTREFIEMLSSNLYSRPKEAMIREVLCNADDAHKEAGYTGPIEITLTDDNTLIIRDRGFGIPHEKMPIIYGTYGGSTKKKDSMATGGFGLGCKSPWSYTDAFNVANHHAGTKTINSMVRVSNDHGGLPAIVPIASFNTDESGLEVRIDIKSQDVREIVGLVKSMVYRGGLKATLNGSELVTIEYEDDTLYKFIPRSELGHQLMVKYGAVLYPVEEQEVFAQYHQSITRYMNRNSTLILLAPPDSLVISPNRENVSYLEKTQKQLFKLLYDFMVQINKQAEPYARNLISKSNISFIQRNGLKWLETIAHANYLDSPTIDAAFYKLDVFGQIIHMKLTHNYPDQYHKASLKQRFDLTKHLIANPWRKMHYAELRKQALEDHTKNTWDQPLTKFIGLELRKIMVRLGIKQSNLRFGTKGQYYLRSPHNKWTTQPSPIGDLKSLRGGDLHDQFQWAEAPIIISHTIKGVSEMAPGLIPNRYLLLIIPRAGQDAMNPTDVAAKLSKFGLEVIDITVNQNLASGTRVKGDAKYPTLGNLRAKKLTDHTTTARPALDKISKVPKSDWSSAPTHYMKCYFRGSNTITSPVDCTEALFDMFQKYLPDETAIVTTEADVAKLKKAGAVHYKQAMYDKVVELWKDPAVRQAIAWFSGDRNLYTVMKFFSSAWYKESFNLPTIVYDNAMKDKINIIRLYMSNHHQIHNEESGILETVEISKAYYHRMKEPKKLIKIFDLIEKNPIVKDCVDIDDLIEMQENSNPKLSDKARRILSIVME